MYMEIGCCGCQGVVGGFDSRLVSMHSVHGDGVAVVEGLWADLIVVGGGFDAQCTWR